MISRSHLSTLVYLAFALWALFLTLNGVSLPRQWRQPLPWVVTGLLGVIWCFDQCPVIRQTYSSLYMRLLTKESGSESLAAAFDHARDGAWSLVTVYRNTPGPLVVHRSRPHFGGLIVSGRGRHPISLQGQYWTDRDTRGELHMTSRNRKLFADFASASSAKYH